MYACMCVRACACAVLAARHWSAKSDYCEDQAKYVCGCNKYTTNNKLFMKNLRVVS